MRFSIGKAARWDQNGPGPRDVAPACRLTRHVTFRAQRSIQRSRFMEYTATPPPPRSGQDSTMRPRASCARQQTKRPAVPSTETARAVHPGASPPVRFESCNVTRFRYRIVTARPDTMRRNLAPPRARRSRCRPCNVTRALERQAQRIPAPSGQAGGFRVFPYGP